MSSIARRRVAAMVVGAAALAFMAGCGSFFGSGSSASTTLPTLPATTTTVLAVATTSVGPIEYAIERGDTMRKIAGKFNTSVEAILAINPKITDQNKIQAGQVILIPPPTVPAETTVPTETTAPPASSTG